MAAHRLGIAQPAASRLAAELETILGTPLYTRSGRGITLTPAGQILCQQAAAILRQIADTGHTIDELKSGSTGSLAIGSVTGPSIEHVLPLLRQLRVSFPHILVEVEVSTSDHLCDMVAAGQLDFALARPPRDPAEMAFIYHPIADEPVELIVRPGHPILSGAGPVTLSDMLAYDWVLPQPGKILRTTIDRQFMNRTGRLPQRVLNSSSFLLMLATIGQTNAVAVVARSVADYFATGGLISRVPLDIDIHVEPYGIVTAKDRTPTAAANQALSILHSLLTANDASQDTPSKSEAY